MLILFKWNPFVNIFNNIDLYYEPLEKISTQNGPPKKNNKIIVKIIK